MFSYYSSVGLQIDWFPKFVDMFRDWFSKKRKMADQLASDHASKKKAVVILRGKLAKVETELEVIRVAVEAARTGESKFDFTQFEE